MIIIYLTCASDEEADQITNTLLDKRLVACAKKMSINSTFWWEGKKDKADEVLVIFETADDKFDQISEQVHFLHSYDAPMLFSIQVHKTTIAVEKWLKEEIS